MIPAPRMNKIRNFEIEFTAAKVSYVEDYYLFIILNDYSSIRKWTVDRCGGGVWRCGTTEGGRNWWDHFKWNPMQCQMQSHRLRIDLRTLQANVIARMQYVLSCDANKQHFCCPLPWPIFVDKWISISISMRLIEPPTIDDWSEENADFY